MNWPRQVLKILPRMPSGLITLPIRTLCGSMLLRALLTWREKRVLAGTSNLGRVLIIADVNIGDAINIQPAAEVLDQLVPECRVDFVHSATARPLVEHNPAIARSLPIFRGRFVPEPEETQRIRTLCREGGYDLVLSFCPFLSEKALRDAACPVITPIRLICEVIARAGEAGQPAAGISVNIARYVREIVEMLPGVGSRDDTSVPLPTIYLPEHSRETCEEWLRSEGVFPVQRSVLFNPDASNMYTRVDRKIQIEILERILESDRCWRLFMSSGFTFEGIERSLIGELPTKLAERITVVPRRLPIEAYAVLQDTCDVFLSADTGPMHIAAARKVSANGEDVFRNRTSVVGIFGPTLPRIYGYDSEREGYTSAHQDAPSRVFLARCPRKNLTCSLARIAEQCGGENCFQGLRAEEVAEYAISRIGDN